MKTKRSFSYLMMALNEMEEHLGLQANSQNEKLIFASIILIAEEQNGCAYIEYIKTQDDDIFELKGDIFPDYTENSFKEKLSALVKIRRNVNKG